MKKIAVCILSLFILIAYYGQASCEEFFNNMNQAKRIIDNSLNEGMITGHHGLTLKVIYFLALGSEKGKGSIEREVQDKIAWYNAVNAHRMLESAYEAVMTKEKQGIYEELRQLDKIIYDIGKNSFGWNVDKSKKMVTIQPPS